MDKSPHNQQIHSRNRDKRTTESGISNDLQPTLEGMSPSPNRKNIISITCNK